MKNLKDILTEAFLIKKHQDNQNNECVDLDLPSGNLWAKCNIGANKPGDYGLLFQWGRTDGYKYKDGNHKFSSEDDYITPSKTKYKDGDILKPEDDAAYQATKGKLRMPTKDEIEELIDYTDKKQTKLNGKNGYKFISKKDDSKWIFIPFPGYFNAFYDSFYKGGKECYVWSASYANNDFAHYLRYHANDWYTQTSSPFNGLSVRGVLNK